MGPSAALLPCGKRFHLQHGPIDLVIGADTASETAFDAAYTRFETVLDELMREIDALRRPVTSLTPPAAGETAGRMQHAAAAMADIAFVTPMASVAGAVAETVLDAMVSAADLGRAYVNNGGDIALHIGPGAQFASAIAGYDGVPLGKIVVQHADPVRGIATSGRHGRSLSLGIADSVTVLAQSAAFADMAATLIANAVDLPGHPAVSRRPASDIQDECDLGRRPVVIGCAELSYADRTAALVAGAKRANGLLQQGLIVGAVLCLQGDVQIIGDAPVSNLARIPEHA